MKYINTIILAAAATLGLASCADEGPEVIGSAEFSVNVDVTATTAMFIIDIPKSADLINGIYSIEIYDPNGICVAEEGYWSSANGATEFPTYTEYAFTFRNLEPATTYTYKLFAKAHSYIGKNTAEDSWDYSPFLISDENASFTTTEEGNLESYASFSSRILEVTDNAALIEVKSENNVFDVNVTLNGWFTVTYSTSPAFTNATAVDFRSYQNNAAISDDYHSIYFVLEDLQPDTRYYFKVSNEVTLLGPNIEAFEAVEIVPSSNYFTTPAECEPYQADFSEVYIDGNSTNGWTLSAYLSSPLKINWNNPGLSLTYAKQYDFSDAQTIPASMDNNSLISAEFAAGSVDADWSYYFYVTANLYYDYASQYGFSYGTYLLFPYYGARLTSYSESIPFTR